ncbi:PREDICTED: solute carrier family 52, riboflavin transporter, member 3-A-like [Polistes canadensis]|uniref:solute carrier family 52, riboflavin transporter, member 3-A-like n=1 Tax=Polistes canadensis TaxID=91411 RepID=UPI000718BD1F|nr:PREDICTED: solute carrier family 52, riboflavin transporter, member 3-A-like [Polistes canadensis]
MTAFNLKGYLKNRHGIVLHLLVVLFGISAWIGVNGIFVQLPILINCSPEGSALPTYIVIAIQMANVGPIIYMFFQQMQFKVNEFFCILGVLIVGNISMALLVFFYNKTVVLYNSEYSLALFILTFFTALVGCFSSVLFMPYLRNFDKTYMISYFIGEGLSGVLPSSVALIQNIGGNTEYFTNSNITSIEIVSNLNFTPLYYFLFIFIVLLLSLIAFVILQYSSFVQDIKENSKENESSRDKIQATRYNVKNKPISIVDKLCLENELTVEHHDERKEARCLNIHYKMSLYKKAYLLILMSSLCFFGNGFLPSIQSYSCLPYGYITYQLSITLVQFANPIACIITFFIIPANINIIHSLSAITFIFCIYVTYVALMSPFVPLQESKIGIIIILISWTILIGIISYTKLVIISIFRQIQKVNILFYVGIIMQAGSASGAIISFTLINFTDFFRA